MPARDFVMNGDMLRRLGYGLLVTFGMVLNGCVTTATHEATLKDLDQCKVDLAYCKKTRLDDAEYQRKARGELENQNASLQQELDSTLRDMASFRGQAHKELVSCVDARHALEAERESLRQVYAACEANLNRQKSALKELEDKAARFREKLQTEIADRNVEIEQLRGQLSVRVLDKILFRSGSAEIRQEGQAVLDKLAGILATENDIIRVEGHTDNVPIGAQLKERYPSNWELSAARASSVVRYFEHAHKIDPTRMEAVGFSMYRPIATGEAPEQLQRNRRVEIVLLPPRQGN